MKITVVGTGYVGLVTGTCLAEIGNNVTCIDIDKVKIEMMQKGKIPIYEPDLDKLFDRNIKSGRLEFTSNLNKGVKDRDVIFLALPTPPGDDGSADLSYVLGVAEKIGPLIDKYTVVVNKSTVPVGTADKVRAKILANCEKDFDVVSNPEFLREGFAVSDFLKPDRIVIGTKSDKARKILEELYAPFVRQGSKLLCMDEKSAEVTKYAANSFLATKISFMNEVANLCELVGADVDSVRLGIGSDERIGSRFLFPGIGYGGSCFPKDVLALQKTANDFGYNFAILDAVTRVNNRQKVSIVNKILKYYQGNIIGKTFALWGLAFKPDTDDIREAPAIEIIKSLIDAGANIVAYDPEAIENVKKQIGEIKGLSFSMNQYDALKDADALIIATEWDNFLEPDFTKMKQMLKKQVIFDGRNLYNLDLMKKSEFYYQSVGREIVNG